jgi:diguanylate cyclase (GGDEF)-like protein
MRLRFWIGLAAVAAIAAGSVVGAVIVRADDNSDFERMQHEEATRSARQAEAVAALSVGQLATAAAFFQTERDVDRHEFDVIARQLLRGALSGTGFTPRVTLSERAEYERAQGFPIVEPAGERTRQAAARPDYFPVTFGTSETGDRPVFGYDLGADRDRGPILRHARDSGEAAVTPIVSLLVSPGRGLIVYQPVYRDGANPTTPAERRAALIGFVSGRFKAPDLAAAAVSTVPEDVDVQLMQDGEPVIGAGEPLEDAATATIRVADRAWLLVLRDPNRPNVSLPILIAVVGLSLAAVLGALILVWSRNERMRELQRQAGQDALTGLKNRRRFEEDLRNEMARSRREGIEGGLLMIDLDNFKRVNDTLGHPVGDRMIEEIAHVLRGRTRETDVLARLGGDEFAVVLPRCDPEEAGSVAGEIATAVREHVPRQDGVPRITVSIGIAMFDGGKETSLETVVAEADAAMYSAKDAGRDAVRVFDPLAVRDES